MNITGARKCILAYSFLKAFFISLLFVLLSYTLILSGFITGVLGFIFPLCISLVFFHTQLGRLISYTMLILFSHALYRRKYVLGILVQVLWANTHIFAVFGPPLAFFINIIGSKKIGGNTKIGEKEIIFPVLCFFASLINPYHIMIYYEILEHILMFYEGFTKNINFARIPENKSIFFNPKSQITKMKIIMVFALSGIYFLCTDEKRKLIFLSPFVAVPFLIRRFLVFPVFLFSFHMKIRRERKLLVYLLFIFLAFPSVKLFMYYRDFYGRFNRFSEMMLFSREFVERCRGVVHSGFPSILVFFMYPHSTAYYDFYSSWNRLEKYREVSDTYEELLSAGVRCIVSSPQFYRRTPSRFPRAVLKRVGFFILVDFELVRRFYFMNH